MTTRTLTAIALLATAAAVAACVSGCTAQPAASLEPTTLTLYHVDGGPELDPAVGWFVDAVAERSGGKVTIEVTQPCCGGDNNVEENLVSAVASGDADLGWVGTRVFPELGVTSLEALTAPLLIDDYGLEQTALASDEAQKALADVAALDVVPLALVPGSLRYPLAADAPIVSLADWSGLTVAAFHSTQNADSISALGATPVDVSFEDRDQGIYDGTIQVLENSVIAQDLDREQTLPYATVDVGLWPRASALIADPGSDAASGSVAEILKQAAADVVAKTAQLRELDVAAMASACSSGARFALAGADGLAAMRDAVQPVLDGIAGDADAAPLLAAVQASAKEVERTPLTIPAGCDGPAPVLDAALTGGDPSVVNGSFETVVYTEQQLLDAGFPAQEAINASAQFTLVFDDGDFTLVTSDNGLVGGCDGEYTVEGDLLAVDYFPGGDCGKGGVYFTATFAVDDTALTLTDVRAPMPTDAWLFGNAPLTRVG